MKRAFAVIASVVIGAASVAADPAPANKSDAKELLQLGVKLLNSKDYLGALAVFKDAYRKFPSAKILLDIGTTLRVLKRTAEAANAYQAYLDLERDEREAQRRGHARPRGSRSRVRAPRDHRTRRAERHRDPGRRGRVERGDAERDRPRRTRCVHRARAPRGVPSVRGRGRDRGRPAGRDRCGPRGDPPRARDRARPERGADRRRGAAQPGAWALALATSISAAAARRSSARLPMRPRTSSCSSLRSWARTSAAMPVRASRS